MGSSSSKPNLSGNALAMERKRKVDQLIKQWYEVAVQTPPPPSSDPNLLYQATNTDYYYSSTLSIAAGIILQVINDPGWSQVQSSVSIDWTTAAALISTALANTTGSETGEGYSTCVVKTFEGKYYGEASLFKVMVVALSFNFSASEYQTGQDVAAFGYWVYLLRTTSPFRSDRESSEPSYVEPRPYDIPPDMNIVGRKYMTVAELDRY